MNTQLWHRHLISVPTLSCGMSSHNYSKPFRPSCKAALHLESPAHVSLEHPASARNSAELSNITSKMCDFIKGREICVSQARLSCSGHFQGFSVRSTGLSPCPSMLPPYSAFLPRPSVLHLAVRSISLDSSSFDSCNSDRLNSGITANPGCGPCTSAASGKKARHSPHGRMKSSQEAPT